MDTMWISEFLFLYFQCFGISSMQVAELVKTIRYPEENTVNISCWNTSQIQIQNISVQVEETTCGPIPCVLTWNDIHDIEDNCNGENSCLVDYNFTSTCLREFRYINLSYTCKHENGTSISTFEKDFGDWNDTSSNSFTWHRSNLLSDHTIMANPGSKGYSLNVPSYSGRAGTERIYTNNAFMEPICLSLWYQFYSNAYDCSFSIYKISDGNQTLIFTAEGNSTILNDWINISKDVFGQDPFKIALEADFKYRDSEAVRVILIDDTSIAYRPCQGQLVYSTCLELNKPIEIECKTQYLAGDIKFVLEPENPTSHLKNCPTESFGSEINTFCKDLNKNDKCKFIVLNFTSGYEECYVSSKNISVLFQCINNFQTTTLGEMSTESSTMFEDNFLTTPYLEISAESSTHFEAIAAGASGGVLLIIIVVIVIHRVRRSKTGKQDSSPDNDNKAYDENQYDYASQQHLTSSESSIQNRNKQNNSNSNTQNQVLIVPDLYNMTDYGTYDVSRNNKHRENPNGNNLYSHTSDDGTYDVSSNNKKRENQNDDNIYSHKADDVYDSAGHHKLPDSSEETYDHFFGQQTEDEYDTTTRT